MFGVQDAPAAFELVVLDPAGRIRFSNAKASAWLEQGDVLCLRRGGVAAASRNGRDALQRLISSTLADANACAPAVPRVVPLPRPGRLPLMAIGLPIARGRRFADFELGAAIMFRDPEVLELPPAHMVREVFGLTPAESEVALGMGSGCGLKDIARRRACSVNTVRTLASRVFQKTGCRRQSEVVRVIGALNDVLAAGAGLAVGLSLAPPQHQRVFANASLTHFDALLSLPLRAPPNQHATIVSRGFAPGGDTGFHLHGCGHEIVCVLEGALTMEYVGQPTSQTGAGQAIYVAPGVIHRGVNVDSAAALSLFHVGIGPAGSIDRRNI